MTALGRGCLVCEQRLPAPGVVAQNLLLDLGRAEEREEVAPAGALRDAKGGLELATAYFLRLCGRSCLRRAVRAFVQLHAGARLAEEVDRG